MVDAGYKLEITQCKLELEWKYPRPSKLKSKIYS